MQSHHSLFRRALSHWLVRPKTVQANTVRCFHEHYNANREEQTFQLTDGRTIGFAEYGELDGTPVFFFHGSPGSRYDGSGFIEIAKKLNLRIITPDRPGHGLSSFQENRKLIDYPKDISELASHLGFRQYHVLGQSGGGPYAVACAYGSPTNELLNTGVVAGMGPPKLLTLRDAGLYTMAIYKILNWAPGLMRWLMQRSLRKINDDKKVEKQLRFAAKLIPKEDRKDLISPEGQSVIKAVLRSAYAQGPEGVLHDAKIYGTPWDFELKDVKRKVKLFYGSQDNRTPLAFGRYYKKHLPNSELTEFDGTSHWTMSKRDEQILNDLLKVEEPTSSESP